MSQTTPGSDPVYKRLYSFPEMVEDLLRSLFPADLLEAVDWPSLGRLPASYVGDDFRSRHGDAVWRVRLQPADGRGEWLYVLVLLEFQSTTDAIMALRVLEYTAMLHRELLREGAATPGRLPPVLPVVLYNGESPWRAATEVRELVADAGPNLAPYQPSQRHVVLDERHASADDMRRLTRAVMLLEQSRSPEDLARATGLLRDWLRTAAPEEPRIGELKRAFAEWLWMLCRRSEQGDEPPAEPPPDLTLEDVTMTLEERVISWREPWIRQGVEQGIRQGVEQGIRQGVEQGIQQGVEQGIQQGVEQGIQQGVEQGLRQGLDRERGLLRHLAEVRFGADTAERLFGLLARENDPQRLAAVGEAIVRCETADDFLRRAFPNVRDTADRRM